MFEVIFMPKKVKKTKKTVKKSKAKSKAKKPNVCEFC
jgi:hypothetical protein|tara:strand:- start:613 stop:723 length:111 start_codon:yes stop_codon:yes gene_type:complete